MTTAGQDPDDELRELIAADTDAVDGFELGTDGPSRILVGIDGSDTSMRAAAYAVGLARRQNTALIAMYCRTSSMSSGMAVTAGAVRQTQDEVAAELRRLIVEASERTGIAVDFVEREGNPYKALMEVADELRVDAIVVGASTQAGHRLVGSLASRLVRDAPWPVTVVP